VGNHVLTVYGRLANSGKACPHYLLAVIEISVEREPETTEPETTEPEITEPETTEPDTTEAETTTPETTETETDAKTETESETETGLETESETQAVSDATTEPEQTTCTPLDSPKDSTQKGGCTSVMGAAFAAMVMLAAFAFKKQ
jgi:hypothetical protein